MKEIHEYEKDLASIRSAIEKSVKFISLSGMSGILAGIYALAGAAVIWYWVGPDDFIGDSMGGFQDFILKVIAVAMCVLIASVTTGLYMSHRKAVKAGTTLWNSTSRELMINLSVPLITGGIFILGMIYNGRYITIISASLIFYGLALVQAGSKTFDEIRYLGFCEITLGLISLFFPAHIALFFWPMGFGVLHILYGTILYNKYDR